MRYNSVADTTKSSFVVAFQNRKIERNSDKVWP